MPSNQKQIIKEVTFTYSPFGKAFEKQIKQIEDQGGRGGGGNKLSFKAVKGKYDYKHSM